MNTAVSSFPCRERSLGDIPGQEQQRESCWSWGLTDFEEQNNPTTDSENRKQCRTPSERTELAGLCLLVGLYFNSSLTAGNDSHWSLSGFLLHAVQDILW